MLDKEIYFCNKWKMEKGKWKMENEGSNVVSECGSICTCHENTFFKYLNP